MTLKCIGSKCHFDFSSDIYNYCTLADKYHNPNDKCIGINCVIEQMQHNNNEILKLKKQIEYKRKEQFILADLESHIAKNQHLIGDA